MNSRSILLFAASLIFVPAAFGDTTPNDAKRPWTILMYGAVDNSADEPFVAFTDKLRRAIDDDPGIELIVYIDRSANHKKRATYLGDDFTSTRLYRIKKDSVERLSGGDLFPQLTKDNDVNLNSADPANLQRFIAWGKATFPAQRYGMLIYSHANGKTMCPDDRAGADMCIAESSTKVTAKERVDFLALELCNMGGIEIAYQWRPGNGGFEADVLLAIPNAGPPLDWHRAFRRIRSPGHAPVEGSALDPAKMTAADFGKLVIEEGYRGRKTHEVPGGEGSHESAGCYDLHKAAAVKKAVDQLAQALAKSQSKDAFVELRNARTSDRLIAYNGEDSYVDLYDLGRRIAGSDRFAPHVRAAANDVMTNVQEFMLGSFGMSAFEHFEPGKHGVFIVVPSGRPNCWRHYRWYTPTRGEPANTGHWSFLKDGATPNNGVVENWYELLESWFNGPDKTSRAVTPSGAQQELNKLQGEWLMVAREVRKEKAREETLKQFKLTVQGNQWTVTSTQPQVNSVKWTLQVDPNANPKTIDLTHEDGSVLPAIYKLDGDRLTLSRPPTTGDYERPTEFTTTEDSGMLIVWKRVSK